MNRQRIILALTALIAVSLVLLGVLRPQQKMSPEELQGHIDSLDSSPQSSEDLDSILEQASQLAEELPLDREERGDFVVDLANWYVIGKETDVLLIYNTGGFGGGPMATDPEWPSIIQGIQEYLGDKWGLSSAVVEHQRATYAGLGFVKSLADISNEYVSTAPVLAAEVGFLNKYCPDLRIIITGRSFGAMFSNEVMLTLPRNDKVYSVQAGRPARYSPSSEQDDRTLLIESNGGSADSWSEGDLWAIMQANLGHMPSTSPSEEGSLQIFKWYLRVPGHAYTWDFPGIRSDLRMFLDTNFGAKQE